VNSVLAARGLVEPCDLTALVVRRPARQGGEVFFAGRATGELNETAASRISVYREGVKLGETTKRQSEDYGYVDVPIGPHGEPDAAADVGTALPAGTG
jgi:hypothetical protein